MNDGAREPYPLDKWKLAEARRILKARALGDEYEIEFHFRFVVKAAQFDRPLTLLSLLVRRICLDMKQLERRMLALVRSQTRKEWEDRKPELSNQQTEEGYEATKIGS